MYFYKIKWYQHKGIQQYYFTHLKKKTKKEFNLDVQKLLRKYGDEYIEQEDCWIGANNWLNYIIDKMSELGYKQIIPNSTLTLFGSAIIDIETDHDDKEWGKIDRIYNLLMSATHKFTNKMVFKKRR